MQSERKDRLSGACPFLLPGERIREEGGEIVGRPRKIKTAKQLEEAWEDYKKDCDNQMVLTHDFSSKNSEFVSKELRRSITYTIEGFCIYIKLSRSKFYETYAEDDKFRDTVTRMREECEIDARKKFELGVVPSQLAGLWMSNYGYSTKTDVSNLADEKKAQKLDNIASILDQMRPVKEGE